MTAPPVIPDHELLRRIGRGAYGEVWLAKSLTGAFRAVKIVYRSTFEHDRPFQREFQGILSFEPISRRHDSQVDILHVGRSEDYFYYVMELADDQATGGQILPDQYAPRTLKSEMMFRSRLPFEECVSIAIALTTALQHLHENGLVHRDVKPSNIIFVNGVPKLADIGLVTGVDATRSYVGTEGFAAPEGPGTPQADLYSLGKVLYEIATGRDRQDFPELPTGIPEMPDRDGLIELNAVIARACRHNPKERYRSAAEMRADLELLQSGKSLARLHRTERRLRFVQRAGAAVTALAALIAVGWIWQARQTNLVKQLAAEKSQLAQERSVIAEQNRETVVRLRVANGTRLWEEGDAAGALLWFAEALPLVTNKPNEEAMHRLRIQEVIEEIPEVTQVLSPFAGALSAAFSPDGRLFASGTYGSIRVWDTLSGKLVLGPTPFPQPAQELRFTRNGRNLLVRASSDQGRASDLILESDSVAAVLDTASGQHIFPRITNAVRTLFSPDDRWIAVVRTNHHIEVASANAGEVVCVIKGHSDRVNMLAFNAEGSVLATVSKDQTARLWSIPSGEPVCPPIVHAKPVTRVAFSPDGKLIATATEVKDEPGARGSVHTWRVPSGEQVGAPIPSSATVTILAFDPRADYKLIAGDALNSFTVRDPETHDPVFGRFQFDSRVRSWAFSPDKTKLAVGCRWGTARVFDLRTGEPITPALYHASFVEALDFSPDGKTLATACDDQTVRFWNISSPQRERVAQVKPIPLDIPPPWYPYAISSQGQLLLGLQTNTLQLVDLSTLKTSNLPLPCGGESPPAQTSFSPNGKLWAVSSEGHNALHLWNQEGPDLRLFTLQHPGPVQLFLFSTNSSRLYSISTEGVLRTWSTKSGLLQDKTQLPDDYEWPMAIAPDGGRIVYEAGRYRLLLFMVESGMTKLVRTNDWNDVYAVNFSPDGTRFASSGGNQSGMVWDGFTGAPVTPLMRHGNRVYSLEWSADGGLLLMSGSSGSASMWDAATGQPVGNRMIAKDSIWRARFSSDSRFVITPSSDQTVRVWDVLHTEPVTARLAHEGKIRVAAMWNTNQLVTVCDPGIIRVWDLSPANAPLEVISDYARLVSGRRLSSGGMFAPLSVDEMKALGNSFRGRQLRSEPSQPKPAAGD